MKRRFLQFLLAASLLVAPGFQKAWADDVTSSAAQSQAQKVTGVVTDGNEPIIGATVKAGEKGAVTDFDGKFTLSVKPGTKITVSYIGYKTVELKSTANMEIVLQEDNVVLNEVVVTALGIKRDRKALGYGVGEVKGEDLQKAKETNVINSLSGKVAGLVVSQTAGGAAGSTRVLLRGNTEMTGNNQPLYVIDGVPLDNTNFGSATSGGGYDLGDGISAINPDDIENMTVLKGPAASALYGSRASHGVILITTKKAGKEQYSVEYNGSLTIDTQLAKWNDVQQVYGMGTNGGYSVDAKSNTNKSWGPKADNNMVNYFDGESRPYKIYPDNASDFFRTGLTASNTVIVSASSGNSGIRFSMTDMRNKDIVPETHMSRDAFNLRANTTLGKVDLDFTANYTRENVKNRPALGDSKSNVGKNLMTLATTYNQEWLKHYENEQGEYANWNGYDPYNVNPYWEIYKNYNKSAKDVWRLTGKAIYNITKNLKIQGTIGTDINNFTFEDYKAPTTPGYETGQLQTSIFNNRTLNAEILALYNNNWGKFDFNATVGGNIFKVDNKTTILTGMDMKMKDVIAIMNFNDQSIQENTYCKQINSIFGSASVGYDHTYYLEGTIRGDKSSTLPQGNNTYLYPSISGSWVFSEYFKNRHIVPYGKLRLSWAQVGSDTDPYQLALNYTSSKFAYPGYTIGMINNTTMPNKDLKPTKTNSFELGLEMKFFDNRFGFDFTYYDQLSKNQILGLASSAASGYDYRLVNAGEIQNRGIELTLNGRALQTKDWAIDLGVNFSKNTNKVKKLVEDMPYFELEKATWCNVSVAAKGGENFGSIIGPDFNRNEKGEVIINPETGLPTYSSELKTLGNAAWDWTGGFYTTVSYKNFRLSAVFDVKVGADLYSMSMRGSYESGKAPETLAGRAEWYQSEENRKAAGMTIDSWRAAGNVQGFVAPGVIEVKDDAGNVTGYRANDIAVNPETYWFDVSRNTPLPFIYDNSYVKCREITLAYTVPQGALGKAVKGLTVSFVARNPFIVWKNIPNIDPDSNFNNTTGMGLEYGSLPSRKSYGLNVNLKF